MWVLSHIESPQKLYILNDKETYTVGRVQHDLILLNDQSVSRDHAIIHRSAHGISVEDKSRFGVFINKGIDTNKGIGSGSKSKLKVGDVLRFGRLKSTFRVEKIEAKVCCSMMSSDDVQNLANQLQMIDGKLQSSWSPECTYLVMTNIVVTMKVLQSLIQGIPIVTPAYWNAFIKHARDNRPELPNVNDFVPEITEPFLIKEPGSMHVHLDRKRIFQGKTFVFMVKRHMLSFRSVIELAAGQCVSLEENRLSKKNLLNENYIPVAYSPVGESQCSADVNGIVSYVESNNRRLISEAEIGLAIIHRSIERFCNPNHKTNNDFQVNTLNTNELCVNILVENTSSAQVESPIISPDSEVIVQETINLTESEPNNNLQDNKMVEEEIVFDSNRPSTSKNVPKAKPATPIKSPTTRASSKRKLNAIDDIQKNQSNEDMDNNNDTSRSKKPKRTNAPAEPVLSQTSSLSSDLMPPPASNVIPLSQSSLDSSGFISTQHRKRTRSATKNESHLDSLQLRTKEQKNENRKRAINRLNADSDDENDDDDGQLFKLSKTVAKKPKVASKNNESRTGKKRNFVDVSDDDDDDTNDLHDNNHFQFSKSNKMRSQRDQAKKRCKKVNDSKNSDADTPDHASLDDGNSFMKPYKPSLNKWKNTSTLDIKESSTISTEWITSKLNKNMNLSATTSQVARTEHLVEVKREKDESDDDADDNEDEQNWVKSLANVFQTRKVDVNLTRNLVIDETDSVSLSRTDSTLNGSKNFKKFVKKTNFIQRSILVKTTPVPVVVSAYSRL